MEDEHLRLVGEGYRRRVLAELADRGTIEVPDDVAREGESTEQVHLRLYHCDLPKLDAADLVDWDREESTVRRGPAFAEVETLLARLDDREVVDLDGATRTGNVLGD